MPKNNDDEPKRPEDLEGVVVQKSDPNEKFGNKGDGGLAHGDREAGETFENKRGKRD